MQKIKALVRTFLFFLFGIVLRVFRSSPIFKRFALNLLRYFPMLARFCARLMSPPPPPPRRRILTPHAAVIFSDLKTTISKLESKTSLAPKHKGG